VGAAIGVLVIVTGGAAVPVGAAPVRASASAAEPEPIDLAVAVDESASLKKQDVEREQDAARRIVAGEISARSRVTVLGFASADSDAQSPVDEVCPTTTLDPVAREKLGGCIGELKHRRQGQGTGTDFPSAIRQALTRLTENPTGGPRLLFLLTDGKLDVVDSPAYGADRASRRRNGETELTKALAEASAAKVEIWPLGFGGDIDRAALRTMAAHGYQGYCPNVPQAHPQAAVVPDAEALGDAVQDAFATARCVNRGEKHHRRPPGNVELRLSPLATLATIVVSKGDKAVTVTYYDPRGHEIAGSGRADGSQFLLTGTGQEVESLRITDPRPGKWRVRLDAPKGHRDHIASVDVQWRGAVRSSIVMVPASPRPGERAVAQLSLQTRDGRPLHDPQDLQDVRVSARLTGDGFDPVPVRLADDGQDGDAHKDDGVYTGRFAVPASAHGALKLEGVLGAVGLTADHRPFLSRVAGANAPVRAALQVPAATVHPGGGVSFTLKAVNNSTTARTLRLAVQDAAPGALSVTPAEVTLAPGRSVTRQGTLRTRAGEHTGTLSGKVEVSDTADPGRLLDARLVSVRVVPVPSRLQRLWDDWWWAIVIGAVLAVCLVGYLVWRWRKGLHDTDPRGLVLVLLAPDRHGERVASRLPVTSVTDSWFRFGLADEYTGDPRLEPRTAGEYAVQRSPDYGARLQVAGGGVQNVRIGAEISLTGELRLRIERSGTRRRAVGSGLRRSLAGLVPRSAGPRRTSAPRPQPEPDGAGAAAGAYNDNL
jgi:von Willebrand factor type A domain